MKETPVGTAWGRPRRKSSLGLRRFGLVVGTIGALTVAPFVSMGVAGASAPTTPKAVTEALNVVSRSFGSVTTLKIQTGSVQTSVATTESAASAKTGQQEGETRWTIEASDATGELVIGVMVAAGTHEFVSAWTPGAGTGTLWVFPVSDPTAATEATQAGTLVTTSASKTRSPSAASGVQPAATTGSGAGVCVTIIYAPSLTGEGIFYSSSTSCNVETKIATDDRLWDDHSGTYYDVASQVGGTTVITYDFGTFTCVSGKASANAWHTENTHVIKWPEGYVPPITANGGNSGTVGLACTH